MHDTTENARRAMVETINATPGTRDALELVYGQVWDTQELQEDFSVRSFLAPFVLVTRRSDGARGTLEFQHNPRFYYGFQEG